MGEPDRDEPLPSAELLFVASHGAAIGKHSERLQVHLHRTVVQEAPLFRLRQVIVAARGVTISSDALFACARRGIAVHFVTGWPAETVSLTMPVGNATVATRRAQFQASENGRGDALARRLVEGKLRTQAAILKYLGKNRRERDPAAHAALQGAIADLERYAHAAPVIGATPEALAAVAGSPAIPGGETAPPEEVSLGTETAPPGEDDAGAPLAEAPQSPLAAVLRGLEGAGGRAYWSGVGTVLRAHGVAWDGREYRGTENPFNASLNYGYGVLASVVHTALLVAGLEPGAGFLHADRAGQSSLVFDAMEEFRQAVVDRPLIGLATRKVAFALDPGDGRLDDTTKRAVADAVIGRLDALEPYAGGRFPLRTIIGKQAERMATYLRGVHAPYDPWVMRW